MLNFRAMLGLFHFDNNFKAVVLLLSFVLCLKNITCNIAQTKERNMSLQQDVLPL